MIERTPRLSLAWILLAALTVGCGQEQPNLLFISMDTTRADHLGAYGHARAKTPRIDALAAEGFLMRRHLTPVPITLPSHTSMMTGHYPPTHTVHDNGTFFVPDSEITLAEVLSEEGYETSAFVGAFPLSEQFGLDQGFALYDDDFTSPGRQPKQFDRGIFFDERPAETVVSSALDFLEERDRGKPFFVFLHVFDPHQPQLPPAPYDLEFRSHPYDGEIAYVDSQLGRLFEALKEDGEWENTVVVLTADHGEGLGEHGELTHAILLHQATLHVPLIIRGPGIPRGETGEWTSSTQLLATLLEVLGIEAPEPQVPIGHSLMPLLAHGGEAPKGWPRFTSFFETIAPRTSQGWSQLVAWMKEDYRLVHGPRDELYQLATDPGELQDLVEVEPEIAAAMLREMKSTLAKLETRSVGDAIETVDAETVDRLAALGYLQANPAELKQLNDLLDTDGMIHPRDRVADVSLFSEAKAAMAAQRWSAAEGLWLRLLERTPDNTAGYRSLALIYGASGQMQRAFEALDRGLAVRPDAVDLLRLKGELLVETGMPRQGLDILEALPSESVQASTWIGQAYQELGEPEEGLRWFAKGLLIEPTNRWLRLYQANGHAASGDFATAEPLFRSLIADAPYFQLAFYNLGRLLLDQGRSEEARGILERSRLLAPKHQLTRQALRRISAAEAGSATP